MEAKRLVKIDQRLKELQRELDSLEDERSRILDVLAERMSLVGISEAVAIADDLSGYYIITRGDCGSCTARRVLAL